jgi:hypothetical protein
MDEAPDGGYGYIPLSRKMADGQDVLWESPEPFDGRSAWIDLIFFARFAPGVSEGEQLERGELLASVRFLARRWRWGHGTVHAFLNTLQKHGRIAERRTGQRGTVYLVVNYDQYNPPNGKPRTPKRTPNGTAAGHLPDKDKEGVKKEPTAVDALVAEMLAVWTTEMGGVLNFGRVKKEVRPLLEIHPPNTILAHWRECFRQTGPGDRKYLTITSFVSRFGLYVPTGLSVVRGGGQSEERYAELREEALRGMDMGDVTKYPDWPLYRDRYRHGEKPKVSRGTLRPAS